MFGVQERIDSGELEADGNTEKYVTVRLRATVNDSQRLVFQIPMDRSH